MDDFDFIYEKAIELANGGMEEEALAYFDRIIRLDPDFFDAWCDRANLKKNLGDYAASLQDYSKALELDPSSAEAWFGRAEIISYMSMDENCPETEEDVVTAFDDLIENCIPDDFYYPLAVQCRSGSLYILGRYEEALVSYNFALSIEPDNHDIWEEKGDLLKTMGRIDESEFCYGKQRKLLQKIEEQCISLLCKLGRYDLLDYDGGNLLLIDKSKVRSSILSFDEYRQYSTTQLKAIFKIQIAIDQDLFPEFQPTGQSYSRLQATVEKMESRINFSSADNEATRNSLLVSHILWEACDTYNLGIFFEPPVDVKPEVTINFPHPLNGKYDCAIALDNLDFTAPIISVVEVKKSSLSAGLGQCVAEMYGTLQKFEQDKVYGIITDGEVWSFLRLQERILTAHKSCYHINNVAAIIDRIGYIAEQFKQEEKDG